MPVLIGGRGERQLIWASMCTSVRACVLGMVEYVCESQMY